MKMGIQMIISLGSIRHLVGLGSPGAVKSDTNGFRSNHWFFVMMMIPHAPHWGWTSWWWSQQSPPILPNVRYKPWSHMTPNYRLREELRLGWMVDAEQQVRRGLITCNQANWLDPDHDAFQGFRQYVNSNFISQVSQEKVRFGIFWCLSGVLSSFISLKIKV